MNDFETTTNRVGLKLDLSWRANKWFLFGNILSTNFWSYGWLALCWLAAWVELGRYFLFHILMTLDYCDLLRYHCCCGSASEFVWLLECLCCCRLVSQYFQWNSHHVGHLSDVCYFTHEPYRQQIISIIICTNGSLVEWANLFD